MAIGKDVNYKKSIESVLASVSKDPHAVGFIINPTPIEQVKAVVESGARMPQKSTDFFTR